MNPLPAAPGWLRATAEAAAQSLLRLLRGRTGIWLWVLVPVLLTGFGFVVGQAAPARLDGRTLFCMLGWWLHATVLTPWLCIFLGVRAVHGPLEDRTFQYLFLRPVPRASLLLGAWLAAAIVGAVTAALWALALFLGLAAAPERWPDGCEWSLLRVFAGGGAIAGVAYAAAAALFGAALRRPLLWATVFIVGLQQVTANLPVSAGLRQLTITDPMRRFVLQGIEPSRRLAADLWPSEDSWRPELAGEPLRDLAWFTGICLVLALWIYSRTDYDARPRD